MNNIEDINSHKNNTNDASEKYKIEQKARINSYVTGATDPLGYEIKKILARGDEYVIYEVSNLPPQESIRVAIDTILEQDTAAISRFNKIKPDFDEFISIHAKYECDVSFKKRAASAITMAINGDLDNAKLLFNKIKADAINDHSEKIYGKLSYQAGALFISLILLSISFCLYIFRLDEFVIKNQFLFHIAIATAFAALGGFLSISIKMKELTIDKGLKKRVYFAYGIERMIISLIGGLFILVLIKSNLIFGFLNAASNKLYPIMAFCLLAGFSETLVPNALKNLEKTSENSNK
ncbi:hypothetical protein [uncultured Tolumonas sp.]|uniref:hypothetical protein n=1 Tax=uncultured Tolumonas sp. TaxID=263765 RepID=UPI00292F81B6|nr:hypothetical protein [uncultured Tolumonas sp.]